MYDSGITILLDSFNYMTSKPEVVPIRDYSNRDVLMPQYEDDETPTDHTMDDFRVLIHSKDQAPLFLGPSNTPIELKSSGSRLTSSSLKSYDIPLEVSNYHAANNLQNKYSFHDRKCRFSDEVQGLKTFDIYSKVNYDYNIIDMIS